MDNSLSESARFAVYREKLKGICEANNLSYVFIKNAYPIKLVIRPLGGVGEQMSMLEEATEDNYISPGASILFTVKDGNLTYRMSKTFTISDTLFNKIKNIFKNMHYLWLQFFFRDLVEGGKLAALGYKMSTAYDKLLATLGMTDEQFKQTYGTVQDLPWRTMSEDVQQLRTEYMGYSEDLATARREVENYTDAV